MQPSALRLLLTNGEFVWPPWLLRWPKPLRRLTCLNIYGVHTRLFGKNGNTWLLVTRRRVKAMRPVSWRGFRIFNFQPKNTNIIAKQSAVPRYDEMPKFLKPPKTLFVAEKSCHHVRQYQGFLTLHQLRGNKHLTKRQSRQCFHEQSWQANDKCQALWNVGGSSRVDAVGSPWQKFGCWSRFTFCKDVPLKT